MFKRRKPVDMILVKCIYSICPFNKTGFQLDWNLLRTFCPSSPNFVRTFGNYLGHLFNTKFYHHKRKLPSALLKLKPVVVLLPFRMVSAVWLIVWLFISWGERSLSIVVSGSGWGTVFAAFCGRCTTISHRKWLFRKWWSGQTVLVHRKIQFLLFLGDN